MIDNDFALFTAMIGGLVITPGPSTFVVFITSANSLESQSKKMILGVLLAIFVLTATVSVLIFFSYLMSPVMIPTMQSISLVFILWLGFKMLLSYRRYNNPPDSGSLDQFRKPFFTGFVISFLNPKPLVFYLSFLPSIVQASESIYEYAFVSTLLIAIHVSLAFVSLLLYSWLGKKVSSATSLKGLSMLGSMVGGLLIAYAIVDILSLF